LQRIWSVIIEVVLLVGRWDANCDLITTAFFGPVEGSVSDDHQIIGVGSVVRYGSNTLRDGWLRDSLTSNIKERQF
jgi:hypothetical protein